MSANSENNSEKRDIFAQIAAQRVAYRDAVLVEPQPPKLPGRFLPVGEPDTKTPFCPLRKLDTAEKLQRELERQRHRHEKFLKNLAPKLKKTRITVPLEKFNWRIETQNDRTDFAYTLAGRGKWERVRIPHYGPPLGKAVTYYRTIFNVTKAMKSKGALFVCFKGVDYKAHVFVNGTYLGSHEGFFAPFEFEFTLHANCGENTLLVKVENDAICAGNASWGDDGTVFEGDKLYACTGPGYDDPEIGWHHCPPGMGIYQDVFIEARAPLHVHDIFVRSRPDESRAEAWIEVQNCDKYRKSIGLQLSIFGQNFRATVFRDRPFDVTGQMGPGVNFLRLSLDMPNARVWDLKCPWLYQVQAQILDEKGKLLDVAARQFGMRSFRMYEDSELKGRMYLNEREIRLRGANTMGHMQQCVIKKNWDQLRDDILLAKICNLNFFRLTQRPIQPEIYEYCDRLGMMTQSDLPLSFMLRRNQFCEGVKQASEMERLVRAHPCNIMVTYINEPLPGDSAQCRRHLDREELEAFFKACDKAVRLQNPDRVIKAVDGDYDPPGPGLPDNHCYNGWYNGHGLDLGRLHKGYWQRVKPGWMHGCGEFGCEALDPVEVMRKYYPKKWLPQNQEEEAMWMPASIVKAQTERFHYIWFDTQHSLKAWVEASHKHQAWVTRTMTEAFRRDNRMSSFAIHLFIDAFPSGWMKTIMDVDRQPKPAYFVYRDALTPLMVNLRADRKAFFSGEQMVVEVWVCNDTHDIPRNARLHYYLSKGSFGEMGGKILAAGKTKARVLKCNSTFQGFVRFKAPVVSSRKKVTVRLGLLDAKGKVLHDTAGTFDVFPSVPETMRQQTYVIGARAGKAARLAHELGLKRVFTGGIQQDDVILIDDLVAFRKKRKAITDAVRNGASAIFLELPAGTCNIAGTRVEVKPCGMGPVHFVSRATGHTLVNGFEPDDFKFWYDAKMDHPAPLLSTTFEAPGWNAILKSGNGNWAGDWESVLAAAEKRDGAGVWCICQVHLSGRIEGNPVAEIFAKRLLVQNPEP